MKRCEVGLKGWCKMNSVLISIKPRWCEKITRGEKVIEVRKTRPKINTPFKCYIYQTGGGGVIGEFVCDRIARICRVGFAGSGEEPRYHVSDPYLPRMGIDGILDAACLSLEAAEKYLSGHIGYCWHIADLKVYDQPKELSNFFTPPSERLLKVGYESKFPLKRTPQSWCYVEELK